MTLTKVGRSKVARARKEMLQGYIECAVWASTDDAGEPLDRVDSEFAPDAHAQMVRDCREFWAANESMIHDAAEHRDYDRIGHDFWLTRNGHGAGFWDGDYPETIGNALTIASKQFGECDLYIGDDGLIYTM